MTAIQRRRKALERRLRKLRAEWRYVMSGASLPTGLMCVEECDHAAGRCVVQHHLERIAEPIEVEAQGIEAEIQALTPLEGELLDVHGVPVLFEVAA